MEFYFTDSDIEIISKTLDIKIDKGEDSYSWQQSNKSSGQSLFVSIYNNSQVSTERKGVLVSVQSNHGYFELHDCSAYLDFENSEIIFIHSTDDKLTTLVIGRNCSCNMYANISKHLFEQDISQLDNSMIMSFMQLSITEGLLLDAE
jgi:hypothetical protein